MEVLNDDVVISGVGGVFPKAENIEEFQNRLFDKENLITTRWTGSIDGVSNALGAVEVGYFDNAYFKIVRNQTQHMDPMYCMALERCYEALLDAGVNPIEIKGKSVGIFMGSANGESDNLFLDTTAPGYGLTGHSRAMLANRISYWLDVKGPSLNVSANWIGGLEVLKLAEHAVRNGHCDAALVGGVNLALFPNFQVIFSEMGLLSPNGTVRCFGADANGIVRSDGIVMLYLQRASDAKRSYAQIVKVDSIFNGNKTEPLLQMNLEHYSTFLEDFYKNCDVKPSEVEFVEAYGSGIKHIDEIEIEGLERVYCKNRKDPLLISAVKSNTGHSEAASALFSLVKVLIAMEAETIPATINCDNLNPNISAFKNGTIKIVKENRKWTGEYAAINAFGINSYYGHILLKANSKKKIQICDDFPRLILAASRTEAGINKIFETVSNRPNIDVEYINLIQEFYAKPTPLQTCRGYFLKTDVQVNKASQIHQGNKAQIWFVYSGMGSQWNNMVGDLMNIPVFAKAINQCHDILLTKDVDLKRILTTKDPKIFDNILNCFVGIAAIQIALTDVLKTLDIVPDGIIGHSVGELGCAYADGCVTSEQMILAAYYRGKASLEATLIKGMMAAIGLGYNKIKDIVPPTIEVACHNGPDSCTISGPRADMEVFVKKLQNDGIFARLVNVANIAYHSQYIKPAAPILLKYLKQVLPTGVERSSKWISTSNKEQDWNTDLARYCSAEYHTNNLLSSVLFEEGLLHIPKDSVLIEIAPHGLLQAILKRSCKPGCVNVPLTQRGIGQNMQFLLVSIGKLYMSGLNINLPKLYPKINYPVSKGTYSLANLARWDHSYRLNFVVENHMIGAVDIEATLNSTEFRDLANHKYNNRVVVPVTSLLKLLLNIIIKYKSSHDEIIFENLIFVEPVIISEFDSIPIHIMVQKGSGLFEIVADDKVVMVGKILFPVAGERYLLDPVNVDLENDNYTLSENDIYNEFKHRGHFYSGSYRSLKCLVPNNESSLGIVHSHKDWTSVLEAMIQQHLFHDGETTQGLFIPKRIDRIAINFKAIPDGTNPLAIHYDYFTNVVSTEGVNVIGLQSKGMPKAKENIAIESIEFVPFEHSNFKQIEIGIICVLQSVLGNFNDKTVNNMVVNVLKGTNMTLTKNIQNVTRYFPNLNFNISTVASPNLINIKSNTPHLVISNEELTDDLANKISASDGYFLVRSGTNIQPTKKVVELFQFTVNQLSYTLLCKSFNSKPIVVTITDDSLTFNHLSEDNVSWVHKLENALILAKKHQTTVYLISHILPNEGIYNFAKKIGELQKMGLVRLLFILNSKFNRNQIESLIEKTVKRNLALTVMKGDDAGTMVSIPSELKKLNTTYKTTSNNVDINYLGLINDPAFIQNYKSENVIHLDYSGINQSGEEVMGVAHYNKTTSQLSVDPILQWIAPQAGLLKVAATPALSYVCAYYCLVIKGQLKMGDTVLIHSGHTPIGMAALVIASSYSCKLFTSVTTKTQAIFLKQRFQLLLDENIFYSTSHKFEVLLAESTQGLKANVILNTLEGSFIETTCSCVSDFGRIVHIGKIDNGTNTSIGMKLFQRSVTFSVVDLNSIFKLSSRIHENIKQLIQEGLIEGSVRYNEYKTLPEININEMISLFKNDEIGYSYITELSGDQFPLDKILSTQRSRFLCKIDASYLIYGGNSDEWCDVVEWLVFRGAQKIVIAVPSKPKQVHINRRLTLFQNNFGVNIAFAPLQANISNGAVELISSVNTIGPIDLVFVLPTHLNHIKFIKAAMKNVTPNATVLSLNGQDVLEPGYFNIQWNGSLSLSEAIHCLDDIIPHKIENSFIRSTASSAQHNTLSNVKKLNLLLPSVENLLTEMNEGPEKPQLIQLTNLGPREIRELPPIILVPGLVGHEELKSMSFNLTYPVYLAVLPVASMSIKDIAQDLVKKIKEVYPGGVYNIVGISWGGPLMVEIANLLDQDGASLHLYFIDSAPNTIKSAINNLGNNECEIETNLLSKIFKIENFEQRNNLLYAPSWSDRVNLALNAFSNENKDTEVLKESLSILKNRLYNAKQFHPSEKLLPGQIHLIRPSDASRFDNCGLVEYCQQIPKITLVSGDHMSIVKKEETICYINENHNIN